MTNGLDMRAVVVALVLAAFLLRLFLWRAVLCVAPGSVRIETDAPADQMKLPPALEAHALALRELGFSPLGTRLEKPWLTAETVAYDFVHPQAKSFATLELGRDGKPRLYYLTPVRRDGFVITANYKRPAREVKGRYLSGGLEDFPPDRVFKAHLRRLESVGQPEGALDQEGRLGAARAWVKGLGQRETRLQNVYGLLWSVGTLGMLGAAFFGKR
ncbi:MAG: hypothetical protein ACT4TC_08325 [Myxococcaceae bacterium]